MLLDLTAAELEELVFELIEADIFRNVAYEQTHFVLGFILIISFSNYVFGVLLLCSLYF